MQAVSGRCSPKKIRVAGSARQGLHTAWKSRRTGSAAEAPDKLMFTVNQRGRTPARSTSSSVDPGPSVRSRAGAGGWALPLGLIGSSCASIAAATLCQVPLAVAIGPQREAPTMVRKGAGRVGVVVAHTFGVALQVG
jgi:hypothetical protein